MSLRHATFSAGRWTATSAVVRAGVQLVQTAALARLLAPGDFGLIAITMATLPVLMIVSDLGISRTIIHFDSVTEPAFASLYWTQVLTALALACFFACSAPLQAKIFEQPQLTPIILALSPLLVLSSFGQPFVVRAEKEFRFATIAQNEVAAALLGFVVAVPLAVAGYGVYAIVIAALVTAGCSSALATWRLANGRIPVPRLKTAEIRPYLAFGLYASADTLASVVSRQADVFVGGLVASPTALGYYSIPRDLGLKLAFLFNPVITRIGFPVMSRLKHDADALREVYRETLRFTAAVNFPVYVGCAVFARELVWTVYGPQWTASGDFLLILAIWGMARSTINPVGSLLYGAGKASLSFRWNVALLLVYAPILLACGAWYGLIGMAWGMLAMQIVIIPLSWYFLVKPTCGLRLGELCAVLFIPLVLSLVAAFVGRLAVDGVSNPTWRLLLGGLVLGTVYWLGSTRMNPRWTTAILEFASPTLRKAAQWARGNS